MLLGLWGLRGLGCALTWGYESVRSHGQDGVGGPCGADCALLPEGARSIEHIGSAHDDAELAVLKEVARQRLNAGQLSFDLPGLNSENDAASAPHEPAGTGCVAPIASNRMGVLLEALETAWKAVGLDRLDGADEVFRQLVTARLIEPTSKQDSLRVLTEAGLSPVSYATVKRHLPSYAAEDFTRDLSRLLAGYARIGRASLVLFDVTTLYFETDKADGFREPGFSKERRLEPQITVGLLTDETGFPLRAGAFEGNKAETATMIPMINDFMDAYDLDDVVVVADAGMISAANKQALERAGLSYVLGSRTARVPHVISSWHDNHPDQDVPDGLTLTQPWPAGPSDQRRDETIYYRYSADRARRTLRGIDTQVAKAEKAVVRRHPKHQPRPGEKGPHPGRVEGLRHQPAQPRHRDSHQRLPPPVQHREVLPHVQVRPASTPHLPPPAPVHRGPPDHRHRSPCHGPLAGDHHWLVHQTPDHHRTPLPHHHHQHCRAHPHSR